MRVIMNNDDRLTKYECARILGIRAAQLSMGAPTLVEVSPSLQHNYVAIAALELKLKVLNIVVRRPLPVNRYYEVNIRDLHVTDDLDDVLAIYKVHGTTA